MFSDCERLSTEKAAEVNAVADRVIVVGNKRARRMVPASEIMQMIGRAGRRHDGAECLAIVLVDEEDRAQLKQDMESDESYVVSSALVGDTVIAFHLLPEICAGRVRSVADANRWFSRSFAAAQKVVPDFDVIFRGLESAGAVSVLNDRAAATELGKIASRYYFDALDLKSWMSAFSMVFELGLEANDFAIAWAFATAPVTGVSGDFGRHWEAVQRFKDGLPPGLDLSDTNVVSATLWWHVFGGPPIGKMKNHALAFKQDSERILNALIEIDGRVARWKMADFFEDLLWRARRGIPAELSNLCKLRGVTKSRALFLRSMGIMDVRGIADSLSSIQGEVDESFFTVLKEIACDVRR